MIDVYDPKWTKRFLDLAKHISSWSKDTTKVGAVIVTKSGDPISFGYNGFPSGVRELPERFERPAKYHFSEHAERNAIFLSRRDLRGCVIFVTHFPCSDCARAIVQSGIRCVVFEKSSSDDPDSKYAQEHNESFLAATEILREGRVGILDINKPRVYIKH